MSILLENWCLNNLIEVKNIGNNIFEIVSISKKFYYISRSETESIFDEDFCVFLNLEESKLDIDFYVFNFGSKLYIFEKNSNIFKLFKYIGFANINNTEVSFVNLAVHGGYELLNGVSSYKKYVEKAIFCNQKSLGLCEYNTLAASLPFQIACDSGNIKSIIGAQYDINFDGFTRTLKFYAKNKNGWYNLLRLNNFINVDGKNSIDIIDVIFDDLIVVLPYSFPLDKIDDYLPPWVDYYYGICSTIWKNNRRDQEYLNYIKDYYNNHSSKIKHVFVQDVYYCDKDESKLKTILNSIGDIKNQPSSDTQYLKTQDDFINTFFSFFENKSPSVFDNFIDIGLKSQDEIVEKCDFRIETKQFYLPKYIRKSGEEHYLTNEDFLNNLIDIGFEKKLDKIDDELKTLYRQRVLEEIRVIKIGGFIDYFLILWDIMQWCKNNDVVRGLGRGSAAGSLLSFLLDITEVDPIEYDLLFERFLNESRILSGLPDIDVDFESARRDDVKKYIEERFGINYVASIGTYSTMKVKMALKDVARSMGLPFSDINIISSYLGDEMDGDGKDWFDIFRAANKEPKLKEFVLNNIELFENIQVILNQPRSSSIHASAVIILPKNNELGEEMDISKWLPVKNVNGMIVSQWEHTFVEKAGFLKEDILGVSQLDKFASIVKMIKKQYNIDIDIYKIPLDNKDVFRMFQKGFNEDVFQFGSDSQKSYSRLVLPENIEHLNAMNALYRPGPMDVNAHNDFAKIKNGRKEAEYNWGTEQVLKNTFGLLVYQEQCMQIAQSLADFTLTEADGLRRALTKKGKGHESELWKNRFIDKCVEKGCEKDEAIQIWQKLEAFTAYGFNRSHSTTYAITGYICQWFKVNYPIQFWITSLQFSDDNEVYKKISEINKINSGVKIMPPDINNSGFDFYGDIDNGNIYWSLLKIKNLGEISVSKIIEERDKNGKFFSLEEFLKRVDKSKVNKKVITNLILSGAFDKIEYITSEKQRGGLIKKYNELIKAKNSEDLEPNNVDKDYYWIIKQKNICGLGYINYNELINSSFGKKVSVVDEYAFFAEDSNGKNCFIGGVVQQIVNKKRKDGVKFCELRIEMNNELIRVTIWPETYDKYNKEINGCENGVILISGSISYNNYWKYNTFKTDDNTEIKFLN